MRKFLQNGHNDGENTHFMFTVINRSPNANHSLTLSLKNFLMGPYNWGSSLILPTTTMGRLGPTGHFPHRKAVQHENY